MQPALQRLLSWLVLPSLFLALATGPAPARAAFIAGDLSFTLTAPTFSGPAGSLLSSVSGNVGSVSAFQFFQPANGSANVVADGSFTYAPNSGYAGTDLLQVILIDSASNQATVNASLIVPALVGGNLSLSVTTPVLSAPAGTLLAPVSGNLGPATAFQFFQPTNGTANVVADGSFTYTPNPSFNGGVDTLTVVVTDGLNRLADVVVALSVPTFTAADVFFDVLASPFNAGPGSLLSSATGALGNLSAFQFFQPANGSAGVVADGSFTYTPNAGFAGTDLLKVILMDGAQRTTEVNAYLKVGEVGAVPAPPTVSLLAVALLGLLVGRRGARTAARGTSTATGTHDARLDP